MSMCLYVKRGPERDLKNLVNDPDALMGEGLAGFGGENGVVAGLGGPAAVDAMLKEMGKEAWRGGPINWLFSQIMMGQVRRQLKKSQDAAARAASGAPSNGAPGSGPDILDLHKSWHMLHYLFTGTAWEGASPANTLLLGGREMGEDLGYGPARLVDPRMTAEFAAFLSKLTLEALQSRIDLQRMSKLEIYCAEGMDEGDAAELEEDLALYFPMLKDYVSAAAQKREGLAIWMM